MRIAIVSDIHGNSHAFEAVLAEIADSGADETWCLGDLVGYGADPDGCVDLAERSCDLCLVGNHDLAVRGDLSLADFSEAAGTAARWTQEHIARDSLDFLETLEPQALSRPVGLYHASPRDPVWEYVLSPLQAELGMDAQEHRVCFVGHSHIALSFSRQPEQIASGEARPAGSELDLSEDEWLVNPGSVGQPRDGDPRAAWLELDLDSWRATYRRTLYDVAGARRAIKAAGLPPQLGDRLRHGQ